MSALRTAPAAARNVHAIVAALGTRLARVTGAVLEIGSGTGQHAVALAEALPDIDWWPSDPDAAQRASIDAWRRERPAPNLHEPIELDAAAEHWPLGRSGYPPSELAAIWCANVIHITPWSISEGLFRGAGRHLAADGQLLLYGPFSEGGSHHAESNARFDAELRARDPRWGVRDLDALAVLAEREALELRARVAMPANNHVLVFARRDGG